MDLVAKILEVALYEAYECNAVHWEGDDAPEPDGVFGECIIAPIFPSEGATRDSGVACYLFNICTLIDLDTMKAWHSYKCQQKRT